MGFALSGAAGAAAEGLEDLLKRKYLEYISSARLAEDARQADQANVLGHRNAATGEGNLGVRRDEQKLNVDQFTEGNRRYQGEAPIRAAGVRLHNAQAEDLERQPKEADDAFARTMEVEGFKAGQELRQIGARGDQDARVAGIRSANSGMIPVRINTVDDQGNPVTRVLSRADAIGGEFAAAPTTDARNRKAASGRSTAVLSAISELSEKINTGQGVAAKAQGEVAKAAAAANLNDDVSEYEAVVSGFTPLLARAVGHTGVLTEQDVQSVRKMLPQPGDSKNVRDRKINRITSLMGDLSGASTDAAPAGSGTADLVWDGKQFVKPGGK